MRVRALREGSLLALFVILTSLFAISVGLLERLEALPHLPLEILERSPLGYAPTLVLFLSFSLSFPLLVFFPRSSRAFRILVLFVLLVSSFPYSSQPLVRALEDLHLISSVTVDSRPPLLSYFLGGLLSLFPALFALVNEGSQAFEAYRTRRFDPKEIRQSFLFLAKSATERFSLGATLGWVVPAGALGLLEAVGGRWTFVRIDLVLLFFLVGGSLGVLFFLLVRRGR